jgi:3-oxoacyl-[acyl-carrier protein] reductase
MTDFDYNGKRMLIVGGSSGIGNGMAHAFRERGAEVHVWGTRANASDYDGEEGSNLEGLHYAGVNVSDADALEAYIPPFEGLDVLILCQGTVQYRRAEFEKPGWDAVMDVNIHSVMQCARKFQGMLSESNGSIIIVSSVAGFKSAKGNPAYAASKAAAVSLTKTLGEAWATDGIRVNGIAPGLVDTKLTKVTTEHPERLEASLRNIPVHRMGTPADMAGPALFLASPLADYIVGQTIIVDGGLTLS